MRPLCLKTLLVFTLCFVLLPFTSLLAQQWDWQEKIGKRQRPEIVNKAKAKSASLAKSVSPAKLGDYRYRLKWGKAGGEREFDQPGNFLYPFGIHIDATGKIYVTDEELGRLQVFDSNHNLLFIIDDNNMTDSAPLDVATDSLGNIYIAQAEASRIAKYDANGNFIASWGSYGIGDGQFNYPFSISIGPGDIVYATDPENDRVQIFSSTGTFLDKWDTSGSLPGEFLAPTGIHVDAAGFVYVVDSGNFRVQVFDNAGVFQFEFGSLGGGGGDFVIPVSITVDGNGFIFVSDVILSLIQKFDSSGTFVDEWGAEGLDNGEFWELLGIAHSPTNDIYTVDGSRLIVQQFTNSGTFVSLFGTNNGQPYWGDGPGEFLYPNDAACSPLGYVYISDEDNDRIQKFTANGQFLMEWGEYGSLDGEFDGPEGISCDSAGNVYVADEGNDCIQVFDPNGNHLLTIGSTGTSDGEFEDPQDVAVDSNGNIYVVDNNRDDVQKFDSSGAFLLKWGGNGVLDGEFQEPEAIAINSLDQIYVADEDTDLIQVFDTDGTFIRKIDVSTLGISGSVYLRSLAFDKHDNLVILYNYETVVVLSPTDEILHVFGSYGYGNGQFDSANGICVSPITGAIYVVDLWLDRVQRFDRTGALVVETLPNGIGGWRILGDQVWFTSGHGIELFNGTYSVEFRDVNGYTTPAIQQATIFSTKLTTLIGEYTGGGSGGAGGNVADIDITGLPSGFESKVRWSPGDGNWYGPGDRVNLAAGTYTIFFAPLPGYVALPIEITVGSDGAIALSPDYIPHLINGSTDLDGDGVDDPYIWSCDTGEWLANPDLSASNVFETIAFGDTDGLPMLGQFDNDLKAELAVWYPRRSFWRIKGTYKLDDFGREGAIPVPADYDGDGITDPALYDQQTGVWSFVLSSKWIRKTGDSYTVNRKSLDYSGYGLPVPADYDGDGRDEIALYNPETATWCIDGMDAMQFGNPGDLPVPADYNGDGTVDLAVADMTGGTWTVKDGESWEFRSKAGDIPSTIDLDGDGLPNLSWYRIGKSGVWFILGNSNITNFGDQNSIPISR